MDHKFQINLGGIIDLLSNHLYSSPSVYVRELLQNGVDAITARQRRDPDHVGDVEIHIGVAESGRPKLIFRDNGIGLTEEETHRFLSTIGESSKRIDERREDYIGQFGIGLLSCFVVSDEIVMVTKSIEPDAPAVEWRGRADGTYSTELKDGTDVDPGTTVYLSCKEHCDEWFDIERVKELAHQYGALLPFPIRIATDSGEEIVNDNPAPWRSDYSSRRDEWEAYMDFGRKMFNQEFFDCVPMTSSVGEVEGIAYILPFSPSPTARKAHRVYLKNMLLSETSENLLPSWAFFVTCIVNTNGLRPTASRESFYEDETLSNTREALGNALRNYLIHLKTHDPDRLENLIALHFRAIKALAVYDDEFCAMFADWLPFETSLGRMTMGDFREQFDVIRYVPSVDTFRQIAQVASSQGMGIINAGYSYDADIIEKLAYVFDDVEIERIDSSDLAENFQDLTLDQREEVSELVRIADLILQPFKCRAEIRKFQPEDLPALYLAGDDVNFMRSLEQSKDVADEHWASILSNLASASKVDSYAQLCFNFNNPLVRKLARIGEREVLKLAVQMLYVQSLLLGHHPLSSKEMALLNTGLLDLIELSIESESGDWMN